MRDSLMTGYAPHPVEGVTPEQRVEVHARKVACDGDVSGALGHPRIWLTIADRDRSVVDDVRRIREHPLVPGHIPIYGYIYNVRTGRLIEIPQATAAGKRRNPHTTI